MSERLDRIEALLERTGELVASNARSIESWSSRIEEGLAETEEIATQTRQDLSERIDSLVGVLSELLAGQRERIELLEERQNETDQRFNTLLEDARADRQRADARFRTLQEEAQADRQRADQQHTDLLEILNSANQATSETFQTMFLEITRLWMRVNAG